MGKDNKLELKSLKYHEIVRELDLILEDFESGQVDVDELADKYERAVELVNELNERIKKAKLKVEQLSPQLDRIISPQSGELDANDTEEGYEIHDSDELYLSEEGY